jgi:tetratricopeptide (TPR) repeat protein
MEIMEKYTYNDEIYYYNNGKWLTSSCTTVPSGILSELNKLLCNDNFDELSFADKLKIADNAKQSENIGMALKYYETLTLDASKEQMKFLLPRLTSCYRKQNRPQKAIGTALAYFKKYGKGIASSPVYVSLAAAFCDIDDWETAKIYADRANKCCNSKNMDELMAVYARIEKQMD